MNQHGVVRLLLAVAVFGSACKPWASEEIERVISPDSVVEAVLKKRSGGATVSTTYEVYIVPRGAQPKGRSRFAAKNASGLELVWRQPRFLEIRYEQAKIVRFVNWWGASALEDGRYVVELRLVPLTDSWSLSARDRGDY